MPRENRPDLTGSHLEGRAASPVRLVPTGRALSLPPEGRGFVDLFNVGFDAARRAEIANGLLANVQRIVIDHDESASMEKKKQEGYF